MNVNFHYVGGLKNFDLILIENEKFWTDLIDFRLVAIFILRNGNVRRVHEVLLDLPIIVDHIVLNIIHCQKLRYI